MLNFVRWWIKRSRYSSLNAYWYGHVALFLLWFVHLMLRDSEWNFFSGFIALSLSHLYFSSLYSRLNFLTLKLEVKDALQARVISEIGTHAESGITHVLASDSSTIKIVFSSETTEHRDVIVEFLREAFEREGCERVEILAKIGMKETVCAVTDNIIDLVILSDDYALQDGLSLEREIKEVDQNIPVIRLCRNTPIDVRRLASYVRKGPLHAVTKNVVAE